MGIDEKGVIRGRFRASGIRPRFIERFKAFNIPVAYDLFEPRNVLEV
jgi:pilus assembly protein CpaF